MPMETKAYRAVLAQLAEAFPGKGAISLEEAAAYYGVSKRTLQRDGTFPRDSHGRVVLVKFAQWLAV